MAEEVKDQKEQKGSEQETSAEAPKEKKGAPEQKKGGPKEEKALNLVRVFRKDLKGDVKISRALTGLDGVGVMLANALVKRLGFDPNKKLAEFSESDLKKIEAMLENIETAHLPSWLLNRRKDYSSGIDKHLFESDITITHREDLTRMKRVKSYKGIRHMFGKKARGQRTRTTGRKESTIGVARKRPGAK